MIDLKNITCTPRPAAIARIRGGEYYPAISGIVSFFSIQDGLVVSISVTGLPTKSNDRDIFAFHIHEGTSCTGSDFSDTGAHFDLHERPHPYHTGDFPPLFADHGNARMEFWTDRFGVRDILGRTVIIHEQADDLRTQPSGNAGKKIACGVILQNCCR